MDLKKIGLFIAEMRKKKKMTQQNRYKWWVS